MVPQGRIDGEMTRPHVEPLAVAKRWTIPNLTAFYDSRQPMVWLLAIPVGLATGVAAVLFRLGIGLVQWPWLRDMSENVAHAATRQPWWVVLTAPAVGGLLVGLMLRYVLTTRRTGAVPDVMEARIHSGRGLGMRQGLANALVSALSLGAGASAGREGPVVHLGATLAAFACVRLRLPNSARRTLLASGVAGAVSASFNAPIAGVLFAQEVILGHFSARSLVPLVLASTSATIISRFWFGDVAAFTVPHYHITSYLEVPAFVLLGLVAALVSIIFQATLIATDWVARNVPLPLVARPAVGGLMVGAIAVFLPQVLGVGYDTTDAALKDDLPLALMFILIIAKTAATAITLASRFGGGVFSPALYIGALTGAVFGGIATHVFPHLSSSGGLYAILGMGAVAAAVLGAPISTTVMVFELTGGYALSLALLITVSIANGLSLAVLGRSYFHAQLESRGIILKEGFHRVLVRQVHVSDFYTPLREGETAELEKEAAEHVLRPGDTLEAALRAFDSAGAERLPVVSPDDRMTIVGWARQVRALSWFNKALIETSVEEHR
jgi:chloride channel protein, CIC family